VEIRIVDPRDTRWETDVSEYRVYFWSPDGSHCEEHQLSSVSDVREVLDFADRERCDRVAEIFACHLQVGEPGLLRLAGHRPLG
jgi:hypothetical protein